MPMKGSPLRGLMTWACDDRGGSGGGARRSAAVDESMILLLGYLCDRHVLKGGGGVGSGSALTLSAAARTTTDLTAGLWTETRRGCMA